MNNAKYFTRILSIEIDKSNICGTVNQIIILINTITKIKKDCSWIAADILTMPDGWLGLSNNLIPYYFNNTNDLISKLDPKFQFIFGIFICCNKDKNKKKWTRIFDAEDSNIPELQNGFLEIRPFDSSYYEIYSTELDVINLYASVFKSKIEIL